MEYVPRPERQHGWGMVGEEERLMGGAAFAEFGRRDLKCQAKEFAGRPVGAKEV